MNGDPHVTRMNLTGSDEPHSVSPTYQSARGHSNETKQNFKSTRVSVGTNDGEAPATYLHFGLPYRWVGLQGVRSHMKITWNQTAVAQFNNIVEKLYWIETVCYCLLQRGVCAIITRPLLQ